MKEYMNNGNMIEYMINNQLACATKARTLQVITSVIDVASEQRCVVVAADAFVIVLGLQMFTKLLRFNPL